MVLGQLDLISLSLLTGPHLSILASPAAEIGVSYWPSLTQNNTRRGSGELVPVLEGSIDEAWLGIAIPAQ